MLQLHGTSRRAPVSQQAVFVFAPTDPEVSHKEMSFPLQSTSHLRSKMPLTAPSCSTLTCPTLPLVNEGSSRAVTQATASSALANMQQFCLSPFNNLLYTLIQKYLARKEGKQERKSNAVGNFFS